MAATLVTVASYDNALDADYWEGMLDAQGIPVVVADRTTVTMDWLYARALGNIKLQVPEADAARAREILEAQRKAAPGRPELSASDRAARCALLGFLFPPLQLYTLWIVAHLVPRRHQLSPGERRRMWIAGGVALALLVMYSVVWVLGFGWI